MCSCSSCGCPWPH